MKKDYLNPSVKVILLMEKDMLTTSNGTTEVLITDTSWETTGGGQE